MGTPFKCSVSSVDINSFGTEGTNEERKNKFQWPNITKKYKERPANLQALNLFTYTTKYWSKDGDIVCQFFGYNNTPTWPLSENYSKWTLILYKPWDKMH